MIKLIKSIPGFMAGVMVGTVYGSVVATITSFFVLRYVIS